ncbi:phosphoglycerate mutase [archaeon CG_4_10_14_0_2_um_filter_Archaea_38_6]|nr:MAG: phosphoglycerate mutase [archaeon CG07_land_8_20_14_0_80_38_8]PIU89264.1 MAG: phosphoglycerate mutase [archaeon CG06_land_8_20_14_3_00_37_11]PJA23130.1 MAG: phosphoglycerate mutase [archaeon CG_4_10_14_0_2_um_filter_Archaea_38_6]
MKYLFIVLDGAGDKDYKELKNQSPLGFAETPNMDKLCAESKLGTVEVIGKNIAPESDSAVLSLLGYDVKKYYPGRGIIESIGAGMKIKKDSIYFRANFATINDQGELTDTRANRIGDEKAEKLAEAVNELKIKGVKIEFRHTKEHRGVLRITGKGLSPDVTGNHNGYEELENSKIYRARILNLPEKMKNFKPRKNTVSAERTAMLLKTFTKMVQEKLKNHPVNKGRKYPANTLLLRGAGAGKPSIPSMKKMTGLKWAALVEMPVEEGICELAKIGIIRIKTNSTTETIKSAKEYAEKTIKNLKNFDALYVHIKGPDIPAHDGDLRKKTRIIEMIDKEFFKKIMEQVDFCKTSVLVTADHSTECTSKSHTARPTPLMICRPGVKSDGFNKFSEDNCEKGSVGLMQGKNVMKKLLK